MLAKSVEDILIVIDFRAPFADFPSITTLLSDSMEVARGIFRICLKGT
jgi:hypothetical protein